MPVKDRIIEIEVLNWEKFQHHNGKRTYDWFKVSNTILLDPEIRSLTDLQFATWFMLLAHCATYRSGRVKVTLTYLRRTPDVPLTYLERALSRFEQLQWVRVISGTTEENRIEEKRKETTIDQKRKTKPQPLAAESDFNFLDLYENYPRKIGKTKGLKQLAKIIKTPAQYEKFSLAVSNYKSYCFDKHKEQKFIMHFSTFVNNWLDWIEPIHEDNYFYPGIDAILKEKGVS